MFSCFFFKEKRHKYPRNHRAIVFILVSKYIIQLILSSIFFLPKVQWTD
jgi:hypothetical protein